MIDLEIIRGILIAIASIGSLVIVGISIISGIRAIRELRKR